MAVEARHLNIFPPQLIPNREIITNPIDASIINMYNTHTSNYSSLLPLSGTTIAAAASETLLPAALPPQFKSLNNAMKSNSSHTHNNNVPVPRKRSRDSINNHPLSYHKNCGNFSFLGEEISLHIQHQQQDIDNLISQHMEKVMVELEEKRKRQGRMLIEAIQVGMMKRLKAKEEEIEKIGKLNWALEEKVKSLCIENQLWRDLAQTNEATANALRSNLEQVLMRVRDDGEGGGRCTTIAAAEKAESCCGSTDEGWRTAAGGAQDNDSGRGSSNERRRLCRKCGKEESCVLILPCRHLCLCTLCGYTVHTCPICKSSKNASVHVNLI